MERASLFPVVCSAVLSSAAATEASGWVPSENVSSVDGDTVGVAVAVAASPVVSPGSSVVVSLIESLVWSPVEFSLSSESASDEESSEVSVASSDVMSSMVSPSVASGCADSVVSASAGCVLSEKPSSVVPAGSAVFASIFSVSVFSLFWFCTLALICTIPVGITYTARFMARSPASICLYFFTYVTPPDFRSAA